MTTQQLELSRKNSADPVITDFTTCLTCHEKCFCDCESCGCLPCQLMLEEVCKIELSIRGKSPFKMIDSGILRKRTAETVDLTEEPVAKDPKTELLRKEAEINRILFTAFNKFDNPVPYFPSIEVGDEAAGLSMSEAEKLYWRKVVEESTFPYITNYISKQHRQFPFDPTYIRSFQPSVTHLTNFTSRPAFLCDRLYYKFRDGFTCPLLAYRWYTGAEKPPSRGKAAMYAEGRNYWFVCPTDTDVFRIYQRLMRKLYQEGPADYIATFQRCCISWYGFEESLQYMKDFSMSTESDFAKNFCKERLDIFSWDDPVWFNCDTALRFPTDEVSCLAYEETGGGQACVRSLTVDNSWLDFKRLEVDFCWKTECRIPSTLVLEEV